MFAYLNTNPVTQTLKIFNEVVDSVYKAFSK